MTEATRSVVEGLARRTTRRGLFGRGADLVFGALIGAAAGTVARPGSAGAGGGTVCIFPGPPCPCQGCQANGVCAKPCVINTAWYANGCWVTGAVTCCDCTCPDVAGNGYCGCGSDWHNNTDEGFCPDGNASG